MHNCARQMFLFNMFIVLDFYFLLDSTENKSISSDQDQLEFRSEGEDRHLRLKEETLFRMIALKDIDLTVI